MSIGELIDKITILNIKAEKIHEPTQLSNIHKELALLNAAWASTGIASNSKEIVELTNANRNLWDAENNIREKEKRSQFDAEFIMVARSIIHLNDRRSELKRKINTIYQSEIFEEKQYI